MELACKPDFEEAKKYWRAYWAGEIIDRPCISIKAWKTPGVHTPGPPGLNGFSDWEKSLKLFADQTMHIEWLGDAVPFMHLNFGPDQFAAWIGGDLRNSSVGDEGTSWSVPIVEDWDNIPDISHPHGEWWDKAIAYYTLAGEIGEGRFLAGMADMHGNMDALSAIRGPQDLCMDLWDVPEKIDTAMASVRKAFVPTFTGLEKAAKMTERGYMGWASFYSETPFAMLQCDFACMIGAEHFRRWVVPALEEESSFLDHSVYHYDGPDALVHLQDVLSIKGINTIQWVPGAGNPPLVEWMDLLKQIQEAGKGLHMYVSPAEVKLCHKELRPEGVFYDVWASSPEEGRELMEWLKTNT